MKRELSESTFLVVQTVKNPLVMREIWVGSPGWEDPLKEGMATHPSILAWRIPMDRGAWWAPVHRVTKSQTWLSDWTKLNWCMGSLKSFFWYAPQLSGADFLFSHPEFPQGSPAHHLWWLQLLMTVTSFVYWYVRRDLGLIPGFGRSPREGYGNPP